MTLIYLWKTCERFLAEKTVGFLPLSAMIWQMTCRMATIRAEPATFCPKPLLKNLAPLSPKTIRSVPTQERKIPMLPNVCESCKSFRANRLIIWVGKGFILPRFRKTQKKWCFNIFTQKRFHLFNIHDHYSGSLKKNYQWLLRYSSNGLKEVSIWNISIEIKLNFNLCHSIRAWSVAAMRPFRFTTWIPRL